VAIGAVPEGRTRSKFLVLGLADSTVRNLSLEPESQLQCIAIQALPALPESVCFLVLGGDDESAGGAPSQGLFSSSQERLYLLVGLENGVLLRSLVDNITGQITDSRQQLLGARAVKLTLIKQKNAQAVVALSNKSHLCYSHL
jgi:splicing factor 3B subunit 3